MMNMKLLAVVTPPSINQPSPFLWYNHYSNFRMVAFLLSAIIYFYGIKINPLVIAHITLKIFTLKSSMYAVSVHIPGWNFPYLL